MLEGAGSPAEINLRDHDIVNMRMAHAADAACVLVADIDRGGVFASLLGTLELLEPADRARIRGFIINKFRGDESLLRPGVAMIETRLGVPCLGVVPFLHDLGLDEEDGVALEDRASAARRWRNLESGSARALRIGVIALPHMANFTDFDALALEPSISLAFLEAPEEMAVADLLILPGTKQTLDDLSWLEQRGFDRELRRLAESGIPIAGICGGFQMLGVTVEDPYGIENRGDPCRRTALGLLPVRTVLGAEKIVRRVRGFAATQLVQQRFRAAKFISKATRSTSVKLSTKAEPILSPTFNAREKQNSLPTALSMKPAASSALTFMVFSTATIFATHLFEPPALPSISLPPRNLPVSAPNARRASIAWRTILENRWI